MKNFIRIVLVISLVFFASKVLSSDFEITKTENKTAAVINK